MNHDIINLEMTPELRARLKAYEVLLSRKGIPRGTFEQMRIAIICDAITQAKDVMMDRIFSAVGLMLRREFHFGTRRIMRGLGTFDNILCETDKYEFNEGWIKIMQELKGETRIVIHTGDDNRLLCEVSRD